MVKRELRALTGLRGVAALLVAAYHFANPAEYVPIAAGFNVIGGYLAVDCFFILSGFVLAYNYGWLFAERVAPRDYLLFLIKRVVRIYPAYLVILALAFLKVVVNVSGDGSLATFTPGDFVANVLMITGWAFGSHPLIGPSWSVTAELLCYFMLPFALLASRTSRFAFVWLPLAAIAGWVTVIHFGHGAKGALDVVGGGTLPTLRALCGVLMGILVFRVSAAREAVIGAYSNLIVIAALLLFAILWITGAPDLLKVLDLALLVLALTHERSLGSALFSNRVIHYLGEISYSIYLVHALLIGAMLKGGVRLAHYMPQALAYWVAFSLFILATIGLAAILYPVAERGAKKALTPYVTRFGQRLTRASQAA